MATQEKEIESLQNSVNMLERSTVTWTVFWSIFALQTVIVMGFLAWVATKVIDMQVNSAASNEKIIQIANDIGAIKLSFSEHQKEMVEYDREINQLKKELK